MLSEIKKRDSQRKRRGFRIRKKLRGTADKPRMSVFKSNRHLFVQIIDDEASKTILSVGTMSDACKGKFDKKSKEAAKFIGLELANKAKEKNISRVVFDRGSLRYHGLIAAIADSAREAGLQF